MINGTGRPSAAIARRAPIKADFGTLYGLAPDSTLYRSTDAATWAKAATVPGGGPQALGTAADGRVLMGTAGGVFESRDQGATVTKLA